MTTPAAFWRQWHARLGVVLSASALGLSLWALTVVYQNARLASSHAILTIQQEIGRHTATDTDTALIMKDIYAEIERNAVVRRAANTEILHILRILQTYCNMPQSMLFDLY